MNRFLILGFVIAATVFAGACSKPAQKLTGPARISIEGGDTVNWGDIEPGILKRTVVISNAGGDTLDISNVHPSCGCTTAPLSRNKLAPGDTASLQVSIDMRNHHGPQQKSITITSNDSTRKTLVMTLKANIVIDVAVDPTFFPPPAQPAVNNEYESAVTITNQGKEKVTIQPPTTMSQQDLKVRFDMTSEKVLEPGQSQKLVAHVTPLKSGPLQTTVVLKSTSKSVPEQQVQMYVNVPEAPSPFGVNK